MNLSFLFDHAIRNIIIVGLLSLIYSVFLIFNVLSKPRGDKKMNEISDAIVEGASAYMKTQYTVVAIIGAVIFLILYFAFGLITALGFLVGALFSAISGIIGMSIAVRANIRTAQAAKSGLSAAFSLAFKGGAVTGLLVASLALLSISGFYLLLLRLNISSLQPLIALGFGGSLISVFARLGGGIFTKSADVGTDMVGKIEKNIPEDDPRNPGVIADLVGDNVGDDAGMAADLFETYAVSMVAMYKGVGVSVVLSAIAFYPVITKMMAGQIVPAINLYLSCLVGLVIAI